VARDQRTRLNAELAHQYSGSRRRGAKPVGKGSLTQNMAPQPAAQDQEAELEEEGGDQDAEQQVAAEPKKSLFELPRREPSRPSLLPDVAVHSTPSPSTPSAPVTPSSSRKK
jgi:hypothetical protein